MRVDEISDPADATTRDAAATEVKSALSDALRDMRTIAAGLRLPELRDLTPAESVARAVDDHARRTGVEVALDTDGAPSKAPLSTKIALFRATQELLSNATRHGQGKDVAVTLTGDPGELRLTVSDGGPGIDRSLVGAEGHLGLAGIREQAELLGGEFEIGQSASGGALVSVGWPL